MNNSSFARLPALAGPLLILLGAVDPLEGSLAIAAGALLGSLGVRLGGRPRARALQWAMTGMILPALFLLWRALADRQPMLLIPVGLIALSLLMLAWGLRRAAPAEPRCVHISAIMTLVGVVILWVLNAFGGFGEGALSWWWAVLLVPYPLGWLRHLYSIGRWIGEGRDAELPA